MKVVILPLSKKATIHQVTTMLATSVNVLFPGHDHLLTTGADDQTLVIKCRVIISRWLWPGKRSFYKWLA